MTCEIQWSCYTISSLSTGGPYISVVAQCKYNLHVCCCNYILITVYAISYTVGAATYIFFMCSFMNCMCSSIYSMCSLLYYMHSLIYCTCSFIYCICSSIYRIYRYILYVTVTTYKQLHSVYTCCNYLDYVM